MIELHRHRHPCGLMDAAKPAGGQDASGLQQATFFKGV